MGLWAADTIEMLVAEMGDEFGVSRSVTSGQVPILA